jgi:hypothetical protein
MDIAKRVAARYQEISIGALERGVRTLAKKLEKMGLKTEIEVFKTGRGGTQHYGASYVELQVTGKYRTEDGEEDEAWTWVKFLAGGYYTGGKSRQQISGTEGWKPMAAQGLEFLLEDLRRQGWTPPQVPSR